MFKVLITGGSGLIGKELSKQLQSKSYEIRVLGRQKEKPDKLPYLYYYWDIDNGIIDPKAIKNIDYIVHLAGENISEKSWSKEQRIIIEKSRVQTAKLIYNCCLENNIWPKSFISSSAIGYYGTFTSDKILDEESPAGTDFLAQVCEKWEQVADLFANKGVRTVKIRTGVVLSERGGAYKKIAKIAKKGIASALGSGDQYVPWIHIDDLVNIFIKAIEDEKMNGIYNGVAPQHITNKEFTKEIAKSLKKPFFLPKVPAFVLKTLYGEMASIILEGSRVSSEKIQNCGFKFIFPTIARALADLSTN
jgi:uncharacterized protein